MSTYLYQMKDFSGKTLNGLMEAENKADLRKKLRLSRLYLVGARRCDMKKILARKVSLDTLIMFTNRFSSLIDSGIPILSALHILWRHGQHNPRL